MQFCKEWHGIFQAEETKYMKDLKYKTIMPSFFKFIWYKYLNKPPQLIAYYLDVCNFKCKSSQKISEKSFTGVVEITV